VITKPEQAREEREGLVGMRLLDLIMAVQVAKRGTPEWEWSGW